MAESVNTTSVAPSSPTSVTSSSTFSTISTITSLPPTTISPSSTPPSSTPSTVVSPTSSSSSLTTISTPTTISTSVTQTTSKPTVITSVVVQTPTSGPPTTVIVSITTNVPDTVTTPSATTTDVAATTSAVAIGDDGNNGTSGSPVKASTVAPAVIVPVVAIALLIVLGIFFWRRRKQRKEGEELRKKEMEEYSYNPNSDPTIPTVGALSSNGGDESDAGYRGWGTTSSTARKASTTLGASSAPFGIARSDSGGQHFDGAYSPGHTPEHHPSDPSIAAPGSPEGLGALGAAPVAANNRKQGGVNRGISNASSAYSGGQRSDHSDNAPAGFAGSPQYYDEFMQGDEHPHTIDGSWGGQPVIKDVSARRNTRIENPAVFPQHGNAGIAQNF